MNAMSYESLSYIEVEFSAFVPFDVKDSFEGEDEYLSYQVKGDKGVGQLHFKRSYAQIPQHFPVGLAEGGKMEVDRYGQLSRSILKVRLPKPTLFKLEISAQDWINESKKSTIEKKLLKYALELLNKFTGKYAEVTGDFWVTTPTLNEVLSHKIRPKYNLAFGRGVTKMLPTPVHFSGGVGHFISDNDDVALRAKLVSSESDVVSELLMSARDFESREQFKLVVVQCAVAFEYFVYNDAISLPSKNQKNKFMKKHTKNTECGCHIGINSFCNTGLSEHLGIDFSSTEEFLNISKYVTSVRNKIVHGEHVEVTQKQAIKSINSTVAAISYLREAMVKS